MFSWDRDQSDEAMLEAARAGGKVQVNTGSIVRLRSFGPVSQNQGMVDAVDLKQIPKDPVFVCGTKRLILPSTQPLLGINRQAKQLPNRLEPHQSQIDVETSLAQFWQKEQLKVNTHRPESVLQVDKEQALRKSNLIEKIMSFKLLKQEQELQRLRKQDVEQLHYKQLFKQQTLK